MLIEKPLITGEIVTLKLLSGEEIVGKLKELTKDSVTLIKPVTVSMQSVSATQMGIGYLPVLASVEPESTLQVLRTALSMYPVKTGAIVTKNYIEMTTGLLMPNGHDSIG